MTQFISLTMSVMLLLSMDQCTSQFSFFVLVFSILLRNAEQSDGNMSVIIKQPIEKTISHLSLDIKSHFQKKKTEWQLTFLWSLVVPLYIVLCNHFYACNEFFFLSPVLSTWNTSKAQIGLVSNYEKRRKYFSTRKLMLLFISFSIWCKMGK